MTDSSAQRLLSFSEKSKLRYEIFRQECFINKTKLLSATIKRSNLPNFATPLAIEKSQSQRTTKHKKKNIAQAQRTMDIAKSRHITT